MDAVPEDPRGTSCHGGSRLPDREDNQAPIVSKHTLGTIHLEPIAVQAQGPLDRLAWIDDSQGAIEPAPDRLVRLPPGRVHSAGPSLLRCSRTSAISAGSGASNVRCSLLEGTRIPSDEACRNCRCTPSRSAILAETLFP